MNEWIRLLFERSLIDMPRLGEVNFCSQARRNHCRVGTLVGFFTSTVKLYIIRITMFLRKNRKIPPSRVSRNEYLVSRMWYPGFPNEKTNSGVLTDWKSVKILEPKKKQLFFFLGHFQVEIQHSDMVSLRICPSIHRSKKKKITSLSL